MTLTLTLTHKLPLTLSLALARTLPQILAAGAVDEALAFAEAWARRADPSLVRYFISATLAVVAPPYSSPFASLLLRHAFYASCSYRAATVAITMQPTLALPLRSCSSREPSYAPGAATNLTKQASGGVELKDPSAQHAT